MPKSFKFFRKRNRANTWRDYQADPRDGGGTRTPLRRGSVGRIAGLLLALAALVGLYGFFQGPGRLPEALTTYLPAPAAPAADPISKEEVRRLLDGKAFCNLTEKNLEMGTAGAAGGVLRVETTLDVDLQTYLLDQIDRTNSRYVGIVVMEATTGRVLAMAGFDKTDPAGNPCLRSQFPAASLFKIVTAAAAVDRFGYTADSPVHFSGSKHTLYKRQLINRFDRYTTTLPLGKAFAESINPVFGKLGGLMLRRPLLEQSAEAFGFNEPLDFELPLSPSRFQVGDEPYQWAEIASGFNLDTTISPLHGAVMASAVLNAGRMATPSIVDQIVGADGRVLYRRLPAAEPQQAMSPKAATALGRMMELTITSGTARKAFRRHSQDQVLSRLQIGGKTGSIDSATHDVRYDWFVGFARERLGEGQVVVAAMVGHEKFIGTRASEYARRAMTHYFANPAGKGPLAPAPRPTAKRSIPSYRPT